MATPSKKASSARSKAPSRQAGPDALHTEQIRQLVGLMVDNGLTSIEIVNGDLRVSLGRGGQSAAAPAAHPHPAPYLAPAPHPVAAPAPAPAVTVAAPVEEFIEVKSPMVGTFYTAASPDSEPYVSVGSQISEETVVCIIEAMKVMNEIKAECSGRIVELAVKNGQPVEFGQVLFRVKP